MDREEGAKARLDVGDEEVEPVERALLRLRSPRWRIRQVRPLRIEYGGQFEGLAGVCPGVGGVATST